MKKEYYLDEAKQQLSNTKYYQKLDIPFNFDPEKDTMEQQSCDPNTPQIKRQMLSFV